MIALEIDGLDLLGPGDAEGWLLGQGRRALEEAARRFSLEGEVRVRVVRDAEMAELHARTMHIDETTDVLTFDLLDGEPEASRAGRIDADLVVCVDEAARQARQRGHGVERELLLYIVHGVLHCVPGYDDATEDGAAAMHTVEDAILETIGVGAVYGR
ncbi:MAG: rRNA maturation RNase YbeY [Phycisphaerales bacterium]